MKKFTSTSIISFFLLLLSLIVVFIYLFYNMRKEYLPTYFTYNQAELSEIDKLTPMQMIDTESLKKWDTIMFDQIKENKIGDAYAARIYAYTYMAQREFAFLSYNLKGNFSGSIDSITANVLCIFIETRCAEITKNVISTPYSNKLADLVLSRVAARLKTEKAATKPYPEKTGSEYWSGNKPYFGQDTGSWKPWYMNSGNAFRATPPPAFTSSEWNKQLLISKKELADITPEEKKLVVFWAGNQGTITPPGQWVFLANNYLFTHDETLVKIVDVRASLAAAIEDAVIAAFDSKYAYWVKRPNMRDNSIITIMPTPNHPSYPAAHSTVSGTAEIILNYYLPENSEVWKKFAIESSYSRVWGGIHFVIDTEEGLKVGKNVGQDVLNKQVKLTYEKY